MHEASGFVKGWLEARGVAVEQGECRGLPVLTAEVGDPGGKTLVFHGHLDVVPGAPRQFDPEVEGDRLYGRGAYDMKGALAAMLVAFPPPDRVPPGVRVRLAIVGDEESEESEDRGTDYLVGNGLVGDFAITGEPTDLQVGVAAKGVLALRITVGGLSAHGSTPWLGENAILAAIGLFHGIESLPFATEGSEHFTRPSVNLGRIRGGEALNQVPDRCEIDVDIRYLPGQEPDEIRRQVAGLEPAEIETIIELPPIAGGTEDRFIGDLAQAIEGCSGSPATTVGRDGASDAISFIRAGMPAVEFGPVGEGHHGPEEWVSIESLEQYRNVLSRFIADFAKGGSAHPA